MATPIALLVFLLSPAAYDATTHTVGGSARWNTGVNYDQWAHGQTFTVGDSLLFNYDFSHAVEEVKQDDYQSCDTGDAIVTHTTSPTTIALTAVGTHCFLCPRSNYCGQGMKVAVNVVAARGSTRTTPSTPLTPSTPPSTLGESPSTPGTSPSTPGTSPSTSGGGNGATDIRGGLVVGLVGFLTLEYLV